jgi:hypothetical protein
MDMKSARQLGATGKYLELLNLGAVKPRLLSPALAGNVL